MQPTPGYDSLKGNYGSGKPTYYAEKVQWCDLRFESKPTLNWDNKMSIQIDKAIVQIERLGQNSESIYLGHCEHPHVVKADGDEVCLNCGWSKTS